MVALRWFSGGKERREEAVNLIDEIINDFGDDLRFSGLKQVLLSYRGELAKSQSSAPYILSRMSIEISTIVRKDKLTLSPYVEERMAELRKLLSIRYGY